MARLFEGMPFDIPPTCDRCGEREETCTCPPEPEPQKEYLAPESQTARLSVEKRKKGKVVTVVSGLDPDGTDFADLLTKLKNACGAGGTVKNDTIEIQGKHIDRARETLERIGYKVKK
ncbi:MAG: translation initiation factor [Planctomycetales bacterium]|nr:translation initiation factor [Planctomycetales bacterium]